MTHSIITTALLVVSIGTAAAAQGQSSNNDASANDKRCFNGYAYTLGKDTYRYTEHHEQKRANGKVTTWNVTYVGKQGQVIAHKHMDFTDNPTIPTYTMKIAQDGYREGITHENGQWRMFMRASADADKKTKTFQIASTMAADAGFNPLVKQHFDQLLSGKSVAFKFVAAGRESVISLAAHKSGTTTFENKPAVVFKTQLDIPVINWFVDSIRLTYDPDSKRLLEYRGIGNMHNDDGEVYPVRVSYSTDMPASARKNGAPEAACGSIDAKQ